MSDDPIPPPQPPLEYWHATGPAPVHPALLTLCVIAGIIPGAAIVFVPGTIVAFGTMDMEGSSRHGALVLVIGIAIDLATLAVFYFLIRNIRRGSAMAIERRRRGGRFFMIGLLLGCGLACLAEGICFTAAGASS